MTKAATPLERDLIEELGKAAATFSDLRIALELLRHEPLAMACGIAEEHIRTAIQTANRAERQPLSVYGRLPGVPDGAVEPGDYVGR